MKKQNKLKGLHELTKAQQWNVQSIAFKEIGRVQAFIRYYSRLNVWQNNHYRKHSELVELLKGI